MNIAIITQPLRYNYGGILQAFALQNALKQMGIPSTIFEIDSSQHINLLKLILELPKRLLTKYILKKRKYIFSEYVYNNYIRNISQYISKKNSIDRCIIPDYKYIDLSYFNAIIVGSDQVWRPIYNIGQLENMFLKFIPKDNPIKRIAYAASFGTAEWEFTPGQTKECSELLSRFDAVSTRETDGIDLCHKYLNRSDAICTLDPTLLLNKDDYLSLCEDIPSPKEKILYAYILDLTEDIKSRLEYFAKSKGLQLKIVRAHDKCSLTVEEWIAMFRDAECIITDSFHGTVFSIIFQKEFYSITNFKRGGSRFTSLLSQLGLTERLYNTINDITSNQPINWDNVYDRLDALKNFSLDFLKNNLEN